MEQEQLADELDQLAVEVGPTLPGGGHRGRHLRAVRGGDGAPGADVGAVDGEGGDHLAQRVAQLAAGVVAVAPVPFADLGQQGGEPLHLGGELLAHDLQLGGVRDVRVAVVSPVKRA